MDEETRLLQEAAQVAVKLGKKDEAKPGKHGDPRWRYTHAGVVYIMNDSGTTLITSWPLKRKTDEGAKAKAEGRGARGDEAAEKGAAGARREEEAWPVAGGARGEAGGAGDAVAMADSEWPARPSIKGKLWEPDGKRAASPDKGRRGEARAAGEGGEKERRAAKPAAKPAEAKPAEGKPAGAAAEGGAGTADAPRTGTKHVYEEESGGGSG